MKYIHKFLICFLLGLCMLSPLHDTKAEATLRYGLGDKIQDFSFTTYDGQNITLSDVLKEKEAVLINIWATWCGPCRNEFPFMEEAYKQYQDRVEILALSTEPTDTNDVLSAFAAEMGLTFKIGQDPVDFLSALGIGSIPTTMMIDRFGTICFIESGSQPDVSSFTRLFDAFLGDAYTESILLEDIPPQRPNVEPSSEADLAAALNVTGGNLFFTNDTAAYAWPMIVAEKDGRSVAKSTNKGVNPSEALIHADVTAKAGDVIVVSFKLSSESGSDLMQLRVNGKVIKSFGGEKDWMTYAYSVPADGNYGVSVAYVKDVTASAGEDTLWVDSIAVLRGEDAAAAIAENPAYPTSDQLNIHILNESAREIVFTDPTGKIAAYYGASSFYLVPEDKVQFRFDLPGEFDPEVAIAYFNFDGTAYALSDCIVDGKYVAASSGDSITTTGYCDSTVYLYADLAMPQNTKTLTYFKSTDDLDAFVRSLTRNAAGEILGSWAYAEAEEEITNIRETVTAPEGGMSSYVLKCVDQNGEPVAGAMMQVCNDETCQVLFSDVNGLCEFTAASYTWEVHILKAPSGYQADTSNVQLTPVEGGELVFTLTKN